MIDVYLFTTPQHDATSNPRLAFAHVPADETALIVRLCKATHVDGGRQTLPASCLIIHRPNAVRLQKNRPSMPVAEACAMSRAIMWIPRTRSRQGGDHPTAHAAAMTAAALLPSKPAQHYLPIKPYTWYIRAAAGCPASDPDPRPVRSLVLLQTADWRRSCSTAKPCARYFQGRHMRERCALNRSQQPLISCQRQRTRFALSGSQYTGRCARLSSSPPSPPRQG